MEESIKKLVRDVVLPVEIIYEDVRGPSWAEWATLIDANGQMILTTRDGELPVQQRHRILQALADLLNNIKR